MQIVQIIKTLGPHAKAIIKFAIEHRAEFQSLLAAVRELFAGGGLMAAAAPPTGDEKAIVIDVAVECGCTEDEATQFIEACG